VRKGGIVVSLVTEPSREETARRDIRGATFIVAPNRDQLVEIARLIDAGSLRPVIATVFALGEAKEAFELGLRKHTRGKIVLSVID
jgi:NADPH:quinone reductase-like Zn-dependent oxidoreductase